MPIHRTRDAARTTTLAAVIFLAMSPALAFAEPTSGVANWLKGDALTGDWGSARPWLEKHGITFEARFSQFLQGLAAGADNHPFDYGGKIDLRLTINFGKLGLVPGLSMVVHPEYNFGHSANNTAGTMMPVNTGLFVPGLGGADAFDLSSVYLAQDIGESVSLMLGKVNLLDITEQKPFMGGSGLFAFWNAVFVVPPTGTVPPYLLGALLTVKTEPVTVALWVYDPNSVVNQSGLAHPFADGVTFRLSTEVPVTIQGRSGRHGFVATYSTKDGTDLRSAGDALIPPQIESSAEIKNARYYFAYSLSQYLYQSKTNPKEGFGIFGLVGVSDGNPNILDWEALVGLGGTGLIQGREQDVWGAAYYHYSLSNALRGSLASLSIRDEDGFEFFYTAFITPWLGLGPDLQIIRPAFKQIDNAVFFGLRMAIKL
jgi:porin